MLKMTVSQLLVNTDSEELGLWMSLRLMESEEKRNQNLMAKANAIRKG
jgi:hypothetical protein